jgi:5-(carboxyamino)imidazole ribonucleotide synthase
MMGPVVGMVGGGQLARMTFQASISLNIGFRVLAAGPEESAAQVCPAVQFGDYRDLEDLLSFAAGCDVVTFDHEHVPGPYLAALEQAGVVLRPSAEALRFAQDKLAMRERLTALGMPCPRYAPVAGLDDVTAFAAGSGWPVVLKAVSGGYDGRGVWVCDTPEQAAGVLAHGIAVLVEEHVGFERELAALVARSPHNQGAAYPVVQTVQRDGVCREVLAPAPHLPASRAREAERLALEIAETLGVTGLLAVELFETSSGLLVNELAMRPHNSGHWTIDGARTSQFEQHLRAVLDLPLGAPNAIAPQVVMANVFGGDAPASTGSASTGSATTGSATTGSATTGSATTGSATTGSATTGSATTGRDVYSRYTHVMAADPGVNVHLYGKAAHPGRKIGHVTALPDAALGGDIDALRERAGHAARYLGEGKD